MSVQVAVVGASGRLGRIVCQVVDATSGFQLAKELGSSNSLDELAGVDLVVDVSLPAVSPKVVDAALEHGAKVLVGTSGWDADKLESLRKKLATLPGAGVMVVPNFSVGSVVGSHLATIAAHYFDSVEIIEAHHQGKVDSPSGTARNTAERIAAVRDAHGGVLAPHSNQTARGDDIHGVSVHSLRLAGVVAQQEVIFGGTAETLSIRHDTHSADAYRHGIAVAMKAVMVQEGLVVGLDQALGLVAPVTADGTSSDPAEPGA